MHGFFPFVRRTVGALLHGGLGSEIRRTAIAAPVLVLAGFVSGWLFPQTVDTMLAFFMDSVDVEALTSAPAGSVATAIFLNNVSAAFSAILIGAVPFVYLSALPLGLNFFILGLLGAFCCQSGPGLGFYLLGILPHGIFELPALVLFCAAGLYLCSCVTARIRGKDGVRLLPALEGVSQLFLFVVLPLLLAAALIEAYVTPWLLSLCG